MFIKRFKLFLCVFIPFLSFFLMSQNTFAVSLSTNSFDLRYKTSASGNYVWANNILYGSPTTQTTNVYRVLGYQMNFTNVTPQGNTAAIHFETNIVATSFSFNYLNFGNLQSLQVTGASSSAGSITRESTNLSYNVTDWYNSDGAPSKTLTIYGDIVLSNLSSTSQTITIQILGNASPWWIFNSNPSNLASIYFEQNPATITYSNDLSNSLLQSQISQNNTIISQNSIIIEGVGQTTDAVNNMSTNVQNKIQAQSTQQHSDSQAEQQKLNNIANKIQAQTNAENTANNNISNQNSSDISGAENQATTNLIGVLSNFLTQLRGFSATNCNLDLPFPQFIGGTQTVNICQGKDVLGNFITIVGTLAMVGFYIPLALLLIRMIYNEIRSFTNG